MTLPSNPSIHDTNSSWSKSQIVQQGQQCQQCNHVYSVNRVNSENPDNSVNHVIRYFLLQFFDPGQEAGERPKQVIHCFLPTVCPLVDIAPNSNHCQALDPSRPPPPWLKRRSGIKSRCDLRRSPVLSHCAPWTGSAQTYKDILFYKPFWTFRSPQNLIWIRTLCNPISQERQPWKSWITLLPRQKAWQK